MPRATHRVKDTGRSVIGYVIDQSFYTDDYVKENIELIENLSCDGQHRITEAFKLPELDYKAHIIGKRYQMICEQNPFVRDIQEELQRWKHEGLHQVLQLEGARQTGKTTELLKFAYRNYEYTVYVNLASDPYGFTEAVQNGCTPIELEKYCRRAKLPRFANSLNTILIIDEIQQDAAVYNAIRTLNGNLACDIAVTGSYLGRILGKKDFFLPAGSRA